MRLSKRIEVDPQPVGETISQGGEAQPSAARPVDPQSAGEQSPGNPDARPVDAIENEEPFRRRISNPRRRGLLARFSRWARGIVQHEPTPEELAEAAEIKRREALRRLLQEESKVAGQRMINRLTGLGICYITRKGDGSAKKVTPVRFDHVLMEPNALWFHVNTTRLPWGVSINKLWEQETVDNLSIAVGHKVSVRYTEESGVWYVVERASGAMGIPNHVQLDELWQRMPASRDNLTIPIGITNNGRMIYESLDNMVHLLIAGTTGGGKSNFLNVVLCTLIRRNRPDQLRMLLVDLKGGLEFNYYDGIPHLEHVNDLREDGGKIAPNGIVYERDGVTPLLDWVIKEGERRMRVLLAAGAKSIGEYNSRKRKSLMPQMVVVIDEWADVKLGKGGRETEERLANAVQRMRAVGIHMIVCTQVPQREVLGTLIKANLPAKFAFSCADLQGSMSILNTAQALNLQPRGRCIFRFQQALTVQTPFISKPIILRTVQEAITGQRAEDATRHDVTPEEVMQYALDSLNGWLTIDQLYNHYRERGITRQELMDWLNEWEENDYLIGSSMYRVIPPSGSRGRRLVVVTDEEAEENV